MTRGSDLRNASRSTRGTVGALAALWIEGTAAAVAFTVFAGVLDYPWQLAMLLALALAAFTYSARRTVGRLRGTYRRFDAGWTRDEDSPSDVEEGSGGDGARSTQGNASRPITRSR
ncbi:MAG: hypothetical protein AAGN46_10765 [Acidobacteriota bacterium]